VNQQGQQLQPRKRKKELSPFPFFFAFDAISKVKHIAIEPGNEIKKDIFSFFALPLKSGILPGVEAPGRCATTPLIG
jgi:hypothetical protein